jgi:serine/threonine protein kinase
MKNTKPTNSNTNPPKTNSKNTNTLETNTNPPKTNSKNTETYKESTTMKYTDTTKEAKIPTIKDEKNKTDFLSNGSYGCVYKNLSTSETIESGNKTTEKIAQLLKCTTPPALPQDVLEKKHTQSIDKIQFIELNTPSTEMNEMELVEHRIVKETLYGETIKSIPNYYMYFAPILSSCPINIDVLNTQDKMKCELFREATTSSLREKEKTEKLYINSKVHYVEGTAPSKYFAQILRSDLSAHKDDETRQLPAFFVTRFIRSYRHLLKAVRLLQGGSTSNSIIIHHDLKDGNIIYDTKRGIPVIIDFGISFDKSVFEESSHPKKLGDVFYRYYNKYTPWSIDVVIMAYIAKVVLLKKGETDDSIKEIYEKEAVVADELKKVCDDFLENNEILKWVDTLTEGSNTTTDATGSTDATDTKVLVEGVASQTNKKTDTVGEDGIGSAVIERITGTKSVGDDRIPLNEMEGNGVEGEVSDNSTRNKMKTQWYAYIESFNGKVWKDLVVDLSQRYASWDVYSLSVCYLQYIYQFELINGKYQAPKVFIDFVEELKTVFDKT